MVNNYSVSVISLGRCKYTAHVVKTVEYCSIKNNEDVVCKEKESILISLMHKYFDFAVFGW